MHYPAYCSRFKDKKLKFVLGAFLSEKGQANILKMKVVLGKNLI